jgi:ribokinase
MGANVRGCQLVRCAVVGHVEWAELVLVDRFPSPGHIAHATEHWAGAAGGGSVVAVQMAKLAGACDFYTALGDDDLGHAAAQQLHDLGPTLHVEWFGRTRRAFTQIESSGERTITTVGPKLYPAQPTDFDSYDAVFFVSGEPHVLRSARAARFLAATPRDLTKLLEGGVRLDLLVGSGTDPGERYDGGLEVGLVVRTEGAAGGTANGRRYEAVPLPGPVVDAYGAGDSFSAALCFALARGDDLDAALELAARVGAAVLTGAGPYSAQISG